MIVLFLLLPVLALLIFKPNIDEMPDGRVIMWYSVGKERKFLILKDVH